MIKAKGLKINKDGFRKDLEDYFHKYMLTYKKQISPFIVVTDKCIYKQEYTAKLFQISLDATVFHTWPGKYKSDVFVFTIRELVEWVHAQGKEYLGMLNKRLGI